ncbi:zinc finger and BTB domain-containing protein 4 [Alligator mississippiensis]|uniref:zinc finger and BTB domain-containing protein 4 n=1 Tax=Alligator mississippiensis TaxID=8496 RepID=UPI0009074CF4|nr:zinc finger and BTB domain-containing protein 4 [Alligator mississippiensis]XP_019351106.1 zinc finger and BTB domain-containing protein 4 [Alligator mississippiensis]XP_019351107.1 zinc finger and BTB domain-containing protein 4 [Alligator mississippiensis]XP_019351108.1 zinc finger and BTB domain-containing protein 4 [Alligator mississippiensis]XP_059573810.1 zinc finger and BTB domain-containing protein 4 [Alligator mississippiensis]
MAPVVEVADAGHPSSLLVQLNEQRLRGQFCDVTIIAEDTKFKAHKNVLAASSPYFKEVLSEEPAGRQPGQVLELPDIQAGVFSDVLNFIYNSRLSVPSPAAAKEIGAVGRRLGISCLEDLDPPRDMSGAGWSPDGTGADSVSSTRSCSSPVDLTCPSRLAEPPEGDAETAKILYALSTGPPEPTRALLPAVWEPPSGAALDPPPAPASPAPHGAYPCGLCSRSFTTSAALGLHAKLHRARRSLSCRHCGKSFIHVKRLQTHEVLCKEATEEDERETEEAAAEPVPPAPPPPPPSSPKPASSKKSLLFRSRGLARLDYDQDHFVKVVDGHLIYFCTVCERSYMTLSSLKRHSNVHSWRRKYPCRYCDKVFALAEYRTKHEVWHTGERRYQCIFCWETFVTYYNLKTHQKAFHGINPGLISSEKTPNGGYKPKLNALKLYRLLPMRSQKRPYKTYSQGLVSDALLLPSRPLPLGLAENQADVFSGTEGTEAERFLLPPAAEQAGPPEDTPLVPEDTRRGPDVPSVIAYGHPAPSVIVHSTSVAPAGGAQAPSVITYNTKPPEPAFLPEPASAPAAVKPIKKQVLRDYIQAQKAAEEAGEEAEEQRKARGSGPRPGRTMTYMAKPAYVGAASESRAAPLCQITVRIGEEAIVKRRISETDLRLDKAPRAAARLEAPARGYANESGDEDSDRDAEDQLWRPYYSYKPKRKGGSGAGAGVPKVKKSSRWRRKLRSLRWMKRGEPEVGEEEEEAATEDPKMATKMASVPHKAVRGGGSEWKHACGACGKRFSALKKLRKHERVHGRPPGSGDKDAPAPALAPAPRVGRKPSVKFTCGHCAKVCKTAAALSRHMKRHEGEPRDAAPPTPASVIAYSKKPEPLASAPPPPAPAPPADIKEETTQEMQVSSSSGEPAPAGPPALGLAPAPTASPTPELPALAVPPAPEPPASTSRAASLQDPVISHTGPAPKPAEEDEEEEEEDRYPAQEAPLPLLARGREDKAAYVAYPSAIQFGAGGKAGGGDRVPAGTGGEGKVSFYPEPYPLMYGHPLLAAYPYNFTLPVALNMVLPDDKRPALPFLPGVFGYAAVNPCRGGGEDAGAPGTGGAGAGGGSAAAGAPRGVRGDPPAPERLKKGNVL